MRIENKPKIVPQHDELEPNLKKILHTNEYGVWKLLSFSFTYHSQKNPFP